MYIYTKNKMISILLPIYNGIEFIGDSVNSVIQQEYTEWELIIGINGHEKDSDVYQIAKSYESKKIKVLDLYWIKGKAITLNEMVKYAKYDFIAILDVDDIWMKEKLQLQSKLLNYFDVIGTQCIYIGDTDHLIYKVPRIPLGDISDFNFRLLNPIINSSSVIRKELCFWNENGIEDYDLWLRLRDEQRRFFNLPNVLIQHRIHKTSAFNSKGHREHVITLLSESESN